MKKKHFVENKKETMLHVLKLQYICLLPNIKHKFLGVFFYVHNHFLLTMRSLKMALRGLQNL